MTAPPRPDRLPTTARLLETMRAEGRRVVLWDRHLARLVRSGAALGYAVDADRVRGAVEAALGQDEGEGTRGLRLTVGWGGDIEVDVWPLDTGPFETAWIDLAPLAEAGSPLCRYKTTARAHYRTRYERARAHGADEAILTNADGRVTEGTRTTVWAERGGRLLTPPLSAGGLGGVYREHVLATERGAEERDLTPDDLRTADAVFLSNALRGWMPVRLR